MKSIWSITAAVIIGFLSGVGSFQMLIAGEVKTHGILIGNLREKIDTNQMLNEKRMEYVVRLLEANAKSNADMITLDREQNRLIERFYMNGGLTK